MMKLPALTFSAPLLLFGKSNALCSESFNRRAYSSAQPLPQPSPQVSLQSSLHSLIHLSDPGAVRHNRRIRFEDIRGITCYEASRRIYHALPTQPLTAKVDAALSKPINWMSRGDDEKLKRASWDNYHDFVMFVCDLEEEDPDVVDELWDIDDHTAEFTLTLGGVDRITLNSEIARECVGLIDGVRMRGLGDDSDGFLPSDDHLSVWIKRGTAVEQLKESFTQRAGRLGWRIMEAFLKAECERTGLDAKQPFESEGRVVNLVEWRSRYLTAALRSLNIYTLAKTLVSNNELGDPRVHQKLYSNIQKRLSARIRSGELGAELLNMHKFQLDMETSASNAICYLHRKERVSAPLTITTKQLQPHILTELERMPDTELKHDLIQMLNRGWVAFKVVAPKHQSSFFLDLRGVENRRQVAGLARGATCYIMSDGWEGLSRSCNQRLSPEELSTCIHEMVHARDWLVDPTTFYKNHDDPLFLTAMEQRAFHYQNQLQRQQQKEGMIVAPRFGHTQHILSHIRRFYTG